METLSAVKSLAALAQESRLSIFRLLVQAGNRGLPAGQIAQSTGIAPSSLSFHLKELLHAQMICSRSEGRYIIYSAQYDTMTNLLQFLTENCCIGQTCLPNCQTTT